MGQSLEAYLQWKLIASLFLGCTEAVSNEMIAKFFLSI